MNSQLDKTNYNSWLSVYKQRNNRSKAEKFNLLIYLSFILSLPYLLSVATETKVTLMIW